MFMAALILMVSTGLFGFYLQALCQKILRRQFTREFSQSIVNANRLEFPAVQHALEELGSPIEYPRLTLTLKCDFLALTYLLKNAANVDQRYTYEERLLILYFKVIFATMVTRHFLKLRETPAALKLTSILKYFANVVGERVNTVRFGTLTASDYLLNL
jgi:hypothetical protein